jgi:hypothetical protein
MKEAQLKGMLREEEKKQQEEEFKQFDEFIREVNFPVNWEGLEDMSDTETKLVDIVQDSDEWVKIEEKMNVKV